MSAFDRTDKSPIKGLIEPGNGGLSCFIDGLWVLATDADPMSVLTVPFISKRLTHLAMSVYLEITYGLAADDVLVTVRTTCLPQPLVLVPK